MLCASVHGWAMLLTACLDYQPVQVGSQLLFERSSGNIPTGDEQHGPAKDVSGYSTAFPCQILLS